MPYWVYLLASRRHGTLYVGVTGDLIRRASQHRSGEIPGFTRRHAVHRLVWFREHHEVTDAIRFEKRLKRWRREWKINLIEADNPTWGDLFEGLMRVDPLHPDLAAALAALPPVSSRFAPQAQDRDL